jgi:hypothetical protein
MDVIRFPHLPKRSGLPVLLERYRGYKLQFVDGEWQLPLSDRSLRGKFPDVLKWHPRISLEGDLTEAAEKMILAIPPDYEDGFEENIERPSGPIEIASAFGISAEVRTAMIEVMLCPKPNLINVIKEHVFPLMIERFGMKYVFPISLEAKHAQATFSLAKILHLCSEHGFDEAERLIKEREALRGIEMTGGFAILYLVDSLTRFAPVAFSYPVNRLGCTWHFYKDGFDLMPSEGVRSTFDGFLMSDAPRAESSAVYGLFGAKGITEPVIWQMLRESVNGTNRLFAYVGDYRNFLQEDGTVDFIRQLKAFGTIRMMFADLGSSCSTVDTHARITFTLGFLDKMANLIAGMRQMNSADEQSIFRGLVSLSRGEHLKHLFRTNVGNIHGKFADSMFPAIDRCYMALHAELGKQLEGDATERTRLERLRGLRNVNHGTFLRGEQFERLYLSNKGELPEELMTLPHLLTMGLLASPEEFIQFDPVVAG